jgi:hypothetical protein
LLQISWPFSRVQSSFAAPLPITAGYRLLNHPSFLYGRTSKRTLLTKDVCNHQCSGNMHDLF